MESLLQLSSLPWIGALVLGLLTALNPCQLAINAMAAGMLHRLRASLHYALGRFCLYCLLAWVLLVVMRQGINTAPVQQFLATYGELCIGPVLILIGFVMFWHGGLHRHSLTEGDHCHRPTWGQRTGNAFLMGVLFALAFCPETALFFFGMLLPLSLSTPTGWLLPPLYALIAALPPVVFALLLQSGSDLLQKHARGLQALQKTFVLLTSLAFIGLGIFLLVENLPG